MSTPSPTPFGKYELLDRIAAGGMAEIFKARYAPAPGVTKQVVIKKILPHYAANRGFIAMFTNEARIAMGLSHGNIAQVFDFGDIDGDYFLAMELVDGQPLSKVLKRARTFGIETLPPAIAAFVAIEMLKGLHYAHTRLDEHGAPLHIVHRDVSPQNVLVSYEGQIKVVDFGIARARNAGVEETAANAVKGKYAYFAPEQARAKELDARTDVFAAGIVLYEMLTGQLPFQGRMMDVLSKIVRGQFPRPRELNPRVPAELERIVLKAMALEKSDRFQSAEAFQQELSRYLASSHPDFTPGELGQFLQLLFEEELVAEGRPVQLARSFVEKVQTWKTPKSDQADAEAATEMVDVGDIAGAPKFPRAPTFDRVPRAKGRGALRAVVLVIAAAAVGFAGVSLGVRLRKGTLDVTSTPPGARIAIDGKDTGRTAPAVLEDLEGARTYKLELTKDGFRPWANDVPLQRGQHLVVDAKLEAVPPPPVEAPPEPAVDAGTTEAADAGAAEAPPPAPVPDTVKWPAPRFELDAAKHRLDLSQSGALALKLDPTKTYRVTLGKGPTEGWGFYVVNEAGAQPGAFTAQPLQMKGVTQLFAFHLPASVLGAEGKDDVRPRPLTLRAGNEKRGATHQVPGTLAFPAEGRVTVTGLDPSGTYELTVRQGTPPARVRKSGAEVMRVVAGHPTGGLVVVAVGEPWRFTGAKQVWLTLLDDAPDEQEGRLVVELREVKPKKKRRR
ncbi:MAG: serine/threonine-protein kinase [Myxococcota bacterium]